MGNIYVRLKGEYSKQSGSQAKYIYGQIIYPGEENWIAFNETQLDLIKRHKDFQYLDLKTQDDMDDIKKKRQEEIQDIATGNWKRSEKAINQMEDKEKLNDIRKLAMASDRKIIIKCVDARLEELKFLEG
ncbi:MAG: hypothetical protein Q8910_00375 [Bacteroidota bacterium]|nr:hypothetical protein [Bacteroidota bacterium]